MTSQYTHRILDEAGVDAVLDVAEQHARQNGHREVIAVVERSGELVGLRRTPGAQVASSRVPVDKARTAATFVRPSRELEQQISGGRLGALALHGARALTGGSPPQGGGEGVRALGPARGPPGAAETVAAECARRSVAPVCAVVDAGGDLMCIWRPDRAQVASVGVATDKARTAAIYRRPSKDFEDQAAGGRASALPRPRTVTLRGRIPFVVDGEVVGAVGASGASSAPEYNELTTVGAAALTEAS